MDKHQRHWRISVHKCSIDHACAAKFAKIVDSLILVAPFARSETCAALTRGLEQLGYVVNTRVLDAGDHGALMSRKRAFLVAQTPEPDGQVAFPWPAPRPAEGTVGDILEEQVPESLWFDPVTRPRHFARSASNADKGRGFTLHRVQPTDRRTRTITGEYGNGLRADAPYVVHPDRPDTLRPYTLVEGKRLMGAPEDLRLPPGKTRAWEFLGQAVYVPLITALVAQSTGHVPAAAMQPHVPEGAEDRATDCLTT
jgi:site-specific DNA-cytosine methylase